MDPMPVLPLLILASSLLPGLVTFCVAEERAGLRNTLNLGAALVKTTLVGVLLLAVHRGEAFESRLALLPGIDLVLHADAWSLMFIALSSLLWLVTTLYAIGYLAHARQRSRFFGFFGLCVSATSGIALSGNLITFLIFYELLTLATYPLVVHKGTSEAIRAGRRYLAYTLSGGALLLAGVAWLTALAGPVEFAATGVLADIPGLSPLSLQCIFALLIVGLGVKAALVPLHGWLPAAMVAPAPVSALLHAVAVVKAGAFGIARVVYDVYGVTFALELGLTLPLAIAASITILYGSVRAFFQDGLKRRLAFSTVSQVSYIALGMAIAGPIATIGGIAHLVHQGLMKITLFFCAGNLDETLSIHKVSQMNGVGRRLPWTMAAFTVAALGMIGVPPLAGFVSKWYLGVGALEAGSSWVIGVLVGSSLLNAAYFLPILYAAWFRPPSADRPFPRRRGRLETHWMLVLPPVVTAALSLVVGILATSSFSPLAWAELIAAREYGLAAVAEVSLTRLDGWGLASIAVPLLLAAAALARRRWPGAVRLLPWAALPALVLALMPGESTSRLPWLFLGSVLEVDTLARPFLLFTALLWLSGGLFAGGYLRDDPQRQRFAACFLLAMAGNIGLILAADAVSFLVFFSLMSLASYGLVIHRDDVEAHRAGRVYIVLVVLGELCLYAALVTMATAAGTLDPRLLASAHDSHWTLALLVVGFGIKAGLVPLHVWLPLAHPVAPAPASAVLSGAMVAAGLLGWLRFLPMGLPGWETWGLALIVAGMVGVFAAALVGSLQRSAKTVLAYSTVSQMGLMTAGVGVALWRPELTPALVPALTFYALHHGLAKGALFLATAVVPGAPTAGATRWLTLAAFSIPALAVVGAPLSSGALAKAALKAPLAADGLGWLTTLLALGAVGSTLLMARFVWLVLASRAPAHAPGPSMWFGWLLAVALVVVVPWWVPPATAPVGTLLDGEALWAQTWPIGLGLALVLLLARVADRHAGPAISGIDPLVPLERLAAALQRLATRQGAALGDRWAVWRDEASGPARGAIAAAGRVIDQRRCRDLAGLAYALVLLGLLATVLR